jgi:hypothetical protein
VAPSSQIDANQVPVQGSGILMVWDSDAIRRIDLTPRTPDSVITDPVLPAHDEFPVIEFGIGQYMAPLPHRLSFPPTRSWGVAEFDPESLYWPSSEEALAILFRWSFRNYPSCLRRAPHESTREYHRRILRGYSRMFESIEFLADDRRAQLYSGEDISREAIEREIGMLSGIFLDCMTEDCL